MPCEDVIHDLGGEEVRHPEEHAGHDHKPDDDPSGLHHLPTVRPLYSLELAPASLKEVDQALAGPSTPLRGPSPSRRRGQHLPLLVLIDLDSDAPREHSRKVGALAEPSVG